MFRFVKKVVVIGGNGSLGKQVVKVFKENWEVTCVDLSSNSQAHKNITLREFDTIERHCEDCKANLEGKYDAILCVAGGWVGGSISNIEVFSQVDKMIQLNLKPALLTAHLATQSLGDSGLVLFTGAAAPFKDTTPKMLAYALSKTATHALALNLATREDIPSTSTVTTILPEVIDTPQNREAMPTADFSKWTDPGAIAGLVKMWAEGHNRPENGSFAILKNVNGQVVPEFV